MIFVLFCQCNISHSDAYCSNVIRKSFNSRFVLTTERPRQKYLINAREPDVALLVTASEAGCTKLFVAYVRSSILREAYDIATCYAQIIFTVS